MSELLPCPFCGSKSIDTEVEDCRCGTYIYCQECSAKSGYFYDVIEAGAAWNKRAALPSKYETVSDEEAQL